MTRSTNDISSLIPTIRIASLQFPEGRPSTLLEVSCARPGTTVLAFVCDLSDSCPSMNNEYEALGRLVGGLARNWPVWFYILSANQEIGLTQKFTVGDLQDGNLTTVNILRTRLEVGRKRGSLLTPALEAIAARCQRESLASALVVVLTDGELLDAAPPPVPTQCRIMGVAPSQSEAKRRHWNRVLPGALLTTLDDRRLGEMLQTPSNPFFGPCELTWTSPDDNPLPAQYYDRSADLWCGATRPLAECNLATGPAYLLVELPPEKAVRLRITCTAKQGCKCESLQLDAHTPHLDAAALQPLKESLRRTWTSKLVQPRMPPNGENSGVNHVGWLCPKCQGSNCPAEHHCPQCGTARNPVETVNNRMPGTVRTEHMAQGTLTSQTSITIEEIDAALRNCVDGYRRVVGSAKWGLLAGGFHVEGTNGRVRGLAVSRWSGKEAWVRSIVLDSYCEGILQPALIEDLVFVADERRMLAIDPEALVHGEDSEESRILFELEDPWIFRDGVHQVAAEKSRVIIAALAHDGAGRFGVLAAKTNRNAEKPSIVPLGPGRWAERRISEIPGEFGEISRMVVAGSDLLLFGKTKVWVGKMSQELTVSFVSVSLPEGYEVEGDGQVYMSGSRNGTPHVFMRTFHNEKGRVYFRLVPSGNTWTPTKASELADADAFDPWSNEQVMSISRTRDGMVSKFFGVGGASSNPIKMNIRENDDPLWTACVFSSSQNSECFSFSRQGLVTEVGFLKTKQFRRFKSKNLPGDLHGSLLFPPILVGKSCMAVLANPVGLGMDLQLVAASWS